MPIFSLPNRSAIGDLGPGAFQFVDFLQSAGQHIWQLLPLGPLAKGDSPYSSFSAFAGNPLLISCEKLVECGLLTQQQLDDSGHDRATDGNVDYDLARSIKKPLLKAAYQTFVSGIYDEINVQLRQFCDSNSSWLIDFARFEALSIEQASPDWSQWDEAVINRDPSALAMVESRLSDEINFIKFQQYLFAWQWQQLKAYANKRGVKMYGDMPIFVAHESADVWTHQSIFSLDESGRPSVVAGVPPDYFSKTGQMWGNPLYNWDQLAATNYEWWTRRFRQAFECFDILRIDHFRGFESYWEIPADAENAIGGQWKPGPGKAPFDAAQQALGELPIVAEDLGLITDAVHALREDLGFPGMRVAQFGFDHEHDPYHRPDCYPEHSFAYTGTHDNDTVVGWYQDRVQSDADNVILNRFLTDPPESVHIDVIKAVLNSAADTAIIPIQDLLGLGSDSRTNTPGLPNGNWRWRCDDGILTDDLAEQLRAMTEDAGRV